MRWSFVVSGRRELSPGSSSPVFVLHAHTTRLESVKRLERDGHVAMKRMSLTRRRAFSCTRHLDFGQELDPSYAGTFMDMGQLLMQEGKPADALAM